MTLLKPALTYAQQVSRLRDVHNLSIVDDAAALEILRKVNYYRLSAYGIGLFKEDDQEKYVDGISLEYLYRLYEFDSDFRNKLIHVIEQIEIQIRTQLSYFIALKYGPEGYVHHDYFAEKKRKDGKSVHTVIMESLTKERERQKNAPFVKHHMSKYDGHFPIWVAVELFTFGNSSSLYSIMTLEDRKEIARLYDTKSQYLGSWMLALLELRNICAHYGRLYNMPLKQTPYLYSEHRKYRINKLNKIFPALLVIKRMLNSDNRWYSFARQIETLIDEYQDVVQLQCMGFPNEWKTVLSMK